LTDYVLDASAFLAMAKEEAGGGRVEDVLERSAISSVNLAEIGARLSDLGRDLPTFFADFAELSIRVVPFDDKQAQRSAELRNLTRSHGLSLGDRACLALAETLDATVLTADRAWGDLSIDIKVKLIR
jgi:ribonuclease VapC